MHYTRTINCTYISNKIGEKRYFPMAGNILPKVNVSSASCSEPVQAGAERRSFCPTVFSPWAWGWQGSAHTQLRRRQCSLDGSAVCLSGALKPGSVPRDRVPWAAIMHTSPVPAQDQRKQSISFSQNQHLLPSPLCSHIVWRPGPQKRLSLLPVTHASSQHLNKCRGHVSGIMWETPHSEKWAHEFCRWDSGVASEGQEEGCRIEIRVPCGEAHSQAYIPLQKFSSFFTDAALSPQLPSPQSCGEKIAKVTSWPTRPQAQCGLLLVISWGGVAACGADSSTFQRSLHLFSAAFQISVALNNPAVFKKNTLEVTLRLRSALRQQVLHLLLIFSNSKNTRHLTHKAQSSLFNKDSSF